MVPTTSCTRWYRRLGLKSLTGSVGTPALRKAKRIKSVSLRVVFALVVIAVVVPMLYLQQQLLNSSTTSQTQGMRNNLIPIHRHNQPRHALTLTAFLEPPSTIQYNSYSRRPWFTRSTTAAVLTKIEFPRVKYCNDQTILPDLPIDDFPTQDPFLPWLHDYFVSEDSRYIRFVAQNKRRCDTGDKHRQTMAFWEPQVTLFQSIPMVMDPSQNETCRFATSLEEATHPATRFQCRFFHPATNQSKTTLSVYKIDYEFITWRKLRRPMIDRRGKDTAMFWLSTLLFSCPIPEEWQHIVGSSSHHDKLPSLYLDLVPIRTPIRTEEVLLTINHTGPEEFESLRKRLFPLEKVFGEQQFLPPIEDAGRWANLPICPRPKQEMIDLSDNTKINKMQEPSDRQLPFQFVACTWTSASYTRRGDDVRVSDSSPRLREWILFHLMVGVEHIYIYDNTDLDNSTEHSDLYYVAQEFLKTQVTYHVWPCKICNNNRPAHSNPGERSSQYAAEASCRERYGPLTQWMTFLDVDEYLVPMKAMGDGNNPYDWRPILAEMKSKQVPILQFLSSRARPRVELMEELEDQSSCKDAIGQKNDKFPNTDACIAPKKSELFLNVYNCEYIRPPKPIRFARARKQIYQPEFVWSHFVHYSTVTADYAETFSEFQHRGRKGRYLTRATGSSWEKKYPDVFVDELTTGALIHARSVMPHETRRRSAECFIGSKVGCMLGYHCEDSVEFDDEKHTQNLFANPDGNYCNCWENQVVSQKLVPLLAQQMVLHLQNRKK